MSNCFPCPPYASKSTLIKWHVVNTVCCLDAGCRARHYGTEVIIPSED